MKGWYITNSQGEVVYQNAWTYSECVNAIRGWEFRDEQKTNKEKYTIRFGA